MRNKVAAAAAIALTLVLLRRHRQQAATAHRRDLAHVKFEVHLLEKQLELARLEADAARARRVGLQPRELELLFQKMDLELHVRQVPPVCCSGLLAVPAEQDQGERDGRRRGDFVAHRCRSVGLPRVPARDRWLPLCLFSRSTALGFLMLASRKTLAFIVDQCSRSSTVRFATGPKRSMGHFLGAEKGIFLIRGDDGAMVHGGRAG